MPARATARYAFAATLACAGFAGAAVAADGELFEQQIHPVLAGICFRCHGDQKVSGELRVDSREALLRGGESGPAIVPGAPEESLLVRAVRRHDDVSAMPPDNPLRPEQVAALAEWIRAGAPWPEHDVRFEPARHWAFQPVRAPGVPLVQDRDWVRNDIDAFIRARQEAAGVRPSPPADRRTLIRRATYDLTGLPPTPEEVAAFVADPSPDAFAAVVDRLLASPHYGEQWGRHWLDVVRYADTAGENSDHPLPHAWRYRNWVIQAFNDNRPYDEFIREQIAGDLLALQGPPEKYADRIVATGYLAIARRFGHDIDKDLHLTLEDAIDTLGKSVLGLTLGCTRCHDHKFDPLTSRDYYGLYGIFESTRFAFPGCEAKQQPRDLVPLAPPEQLAPATAAGQVQAVPVAYAVWEGEPKNTHIQKRGEPTNLGDETPRKFLDLLGGQTLKNPGGSGRLELAEWLTDPDNRLTARVFVNRVWQWHFGRGLVPTPNDFGTRGAPPTHPELLDHLAAEFIAGGWDVKALHRRIMLGTTYQLASQSAAPPSADSPATGVAGSNELYAAFARRRLTAEELRDALLVAAGELDRSPGGAHPFPPEANWSFTQHAPFADDYETARRSVYVMQKRNRRASFFALFDGADPNASTPRRDLTIVPPQALFFINDPFVHRCAERFAARVMAAAADDRGRIDFACRQLFGRPASDADAADSLTFLGDYTAGLADRPADERAALAWSAYARVLIGSNEFLFVD